MDMCDRCLIEGGFYSAQLLYVRNVCELTRPHLLLDNPGMISPHTIHHVPSLRAPSIHFVARTGLPLCKVWRPRVVAWRVSV